MIVAVYKSDVVHGYCRRSVPSQPWMSAAFRNRLCRNLPASLSAAIAVVACHGSVEPSPPPSHIPEAGGGSTADAAVKPNVANDSSDDDVRNDDVDGADVRIRTGPDVSSSDGDAQNDSKPFTNGVWLGVASGARV
jgi:hypothetical protein